MRHSNNRLSLKIHFPFGLISSICLPILCYLFIAINFNRNQFALEIQNWNPHLHKVYNYYPKVSHPKREYITINLSGNNNADSIKLAFIQIVIREQKLNNDKIHGIHVTFDITSELWSYIHLVDICTIEKANSFVLDGNDFWIYSEDKELSENIPTMHCI